MTGPSPSGAAIYALSIIGALLTSMLAGCQLPDRSPGPSTRSTSTGWIVMERVGVVRSTDDQSVLGDDLRPGDRVPSDRRIVTGKGALLILSRGDVQLTARGNTSLGFSNNGSSPRIIHDEGWLRVRLSTAADGSAIVTTPHLVASGSSAVFSLDVNEEGTEATVEQGSVTLSSLDGRHRSQLATGASARMRLQDTEGLMIQNALGQPFTPAPPLNPIKPPPLHSIKPKDKTAKPEGANGPDPQSIKALRKPASATAKRVAAEIEPATVPHIKQAPEIEALTKTPSERKREPVASVVILPASQKRPPIPAKSNPIQDNTSLPEADGIFGLQERSSSMPVSVGRPRDPLQRQFDLLTKDLVSGLPRAERSVQGKRTGR